MRILNAQDGTFEISLLPNISAKRISNIALYTDYNQNPTSTGPYLLQDLRVIQQSLDNLFHCTQYRRRYEPNYYVPIWELIGELFDTYGALDVLIKVKYYVELNEPRVKVYPELSQLDVSSNRHVAKLDLRVAVPTVRMGEMYSYQTELVNTEEAA